MSEEDFRELALVVLRLQVDGRSRDAALVAKAAMAARRLYDGRITEAELQNLCHTDGIVTGDNCPERFAQGCVDYNCKLFGERSRLSLKKSEEQNAESV